MGKFYKELQRRNVIKAALGYGAVGWVVLQGAAIIFPAWNLPEPSLRYLIIILILLFPAWLVFAWVYEYTAGGFRKTTDLDDKQSDREIKADILNLITIWGLVLAVAILLADRIFGLSDHFRLPGSDLSIAVLPFENMGTSEDELLTSGMAEDILTQLGKVSTLRVLSRFTIKEYDTKSKTPADIGKELKVSYLLSGSVRRSGDQLRIGCQLINTREGVEAWSENYDRMMKDIFAIQSDIAERVAHMLKTKLSPDEQKRIIRKPTENIFAYNNYLRGREEFYKLNPNSNELAIDYFKNAIREDSNFGLAWAGLADAYSFGVFSYGNRSYDYLDTSLVLAQHAVQLDEECAECWKALGISYESRGELSESKNAYIIALEKNPNNIYAISNLANLYRRDGKISEAVEMYLKAIGIDPLAANVYQNLARAFAILGLYDQAEAQLQTAIRLKPDYWNSYQIIAIIGLYKSEYGEVDKAVDKIFTITDSTALVLELVADLISYYNPEKAWKLLEGIEQKPGYDGMDNSYVHLIQALLIKHLNKEEDWKSILDQSLVYHSNRISQEIENPTDIYLIASIYGILGQKEKCIEWLERYFELSKEIDYRLLEQNPKFETVRDDPRFVELINKVQVRNNAEREKVLTMMINE